MTVCGHLHAAVQSWGGGGSRDHTAAEPKAYPVWPFTEGFADPFSGTSPRLVLPAQVFPCLPTVSLPLWSAPPPRSKLPASRGFHCCSPSPWNRAERTVGASEVVTFPKLPRAHHAQLSCYLSEEVGESRRHHRCTTQARSRPRPSGPHTWCFWVSAPRFSQPGRLWGAGRLRGWGHCPSRGSALACAPGLSQTTRPPEKRRPHRPM